MTSASPSVASVAPKPLGAPAAAGLRPRHDPLWGMLELGTRASRDGLVLGIVLALLLHGVGLGSRYLTLFEMRAQVDIMRDELHGYFWSEYDVDIVSEPEQDEEAAAEPEPPVEDDPEALDDPALPPPNPDLPPDAPEDDDPYPKDDPPAPAEAADVVAHEADDDAKELDGMWSVADKDGSKSTGGGMTSAKGTAKRAVHDKNAKVGGRVGGTGSGEPKKKPRRRTKKNLSRAATTAGGAWNCPFPPQADLEQVDYAVAVVSVTVGPDGRPTAARIVTDPGYGFGQMARNCAMGRSYRVGLDEGGNTITTTTPPIKVTFRR
jgi:protein TonB